MLAALNVAAVSGADPAPARGDPARDDVEALLRLLVAAGALAEAASADQRCRDRPAGPLPSPPEATSSVIAACDVLADQLGITLLADFHAAVADARDFLHGFDKLDR